MVTTIQRSPLISCSRDSNSLLRRAAQWKTMFGCPSPVSREKEEVDQSLLRKSYRMSIRHMAFLISASRPDVTFITRRGKVPPGEKRSQSPRQNFSFRHVISGKSKVYISVLPDSCVTKRVKWTRRESNLGPSLRRQRAKPLHHTPIVLFHTEGT